MRVAVIDVDGHNFPNLPLMKLSAWHKRKGDLVEWYDPMTAWINPPDKVYMSKVFTFTPDYPHPVSATEIIRGVPDIHTRLAGIRCRKKLSISTRTMAYTRICARIRRMDF